MISYKLKRLIKIKIYLKSMWKSIESNAYEHIVLLIPDFLVPNFLTLKNVPETPFYRNYLIGLGLSCLKYPQHHHLLVL
jgi:hypothetical protein